MNDIALLEELSMNAYPGVQMLHYDGWVLCISPGRWRRSNSVQIFAPSSLPVDEKIAYCESVYAAQAKRIVFKLTPACADEVEPALEARGYLLDAETSIQTVTLTATADSYPDVVLTAEPDAAFTEAFYRIHHFDDSDREPWLRIQGGVLPACGYLRLEAGGETVAVAVGTLERGWMGVFGVGVTDEARRQGHARRIMRALMQWGAERGARSSYLQVMTNNPPALALYDQLGYREQYRYCYRQQHGT